MTAMNRRGVGTLVSVGAAGLGAAVPGAAPAQDTAGAATQLGTITVSDEATSANANEATVTSAGRSLAGTVKDTPQVVNVVSPEVLKQKHVTTLEEALKNVPGVTLSSGEGRGGLNGEQFRLRGIQSKGDIFTDGLKDFGTYTHDMFNTESVTVLKGPSGEAYGIGSLGGLMNMETKKAHLGDANEAALSYSSGTTLRETLDMNKQLGETSAIRLNVMNQRGYAPDRDHVSQNRQGVALDYGLGIGTGTEWHVGYEYLRGKGKPDQGQPMATGADGIARPLLEFDVPGYDRSTSYVRSIDKDITETHMLTSSFSHVADSGFTITNDTRIKHYSRDFATTTPGACDEACLSSLLSGGSAVMAYGAGGGMNYDQDGWGFENLTAAHFDGDVFGMKNKALIGLDISYQKDDRVRGSWTGRVNDQDVVNPAYQMPGAVQSFTYSQPANAKSLDLGLVASDRLWLTDKWSVLGSARADYFNSTFDGYTIGATEASHGESETSRISPAFSVIYEPGKDTTVYASASRAYRPIGTDIGASAEGTSSSVAAEGYDPERSDNVELGAKTNLFDNALGLSAAVFQTRKTNSFTENSDGTYSTGFSEDGSAVRVRGIELGASGRITQDWTVNLAYAYLDGDVIGGKGIDGETVGNAAPYVSKHNLSLWTNYRLSPKAIALPGDVSVGGGVTYASKYYTNATNTAQIPETISFDMSVAYETDGYRLALNAFNLTDHDNYSAGFGGSRATPSYGRTFAVTLSKAF